ncbi:hypothetical protein BGZ65_012408, partial [Modicella reniformis]
SALGVNSKDPDITQPPNFSPRQIRQQLHSFTMTKEAPRSNEPAANAAAGSATHLPPPLPRCSIMTLGTNNVPTISSNGQ